MKHYLTFKDNKSDKFWQIESAGYLEREPDLDSLRYLVDFHELLRRTNMKKL